MNYYLQMKQEAKFTTMLMPWITENLGTCAWEIKHTRGKKYFLMRELKEHQRMFLLRAKKRGLSYKIPDDGRAYKPFDGFTIKQAPAYVILCYPGMFYVIDIEKILRYKHARLSESLAFDMSLFRGQLQDL